MLFGEHSTMKVVRCRNEILNVHRHFDTNCGNSLIYSERAEWCFAATIGLQKKAGRGQRHPKKSAYGERPSLI